MTFRFLTSATALICFVLAGVWAFAPQQMLAIWDVGYSQSTGLVSRRAAALFLGLGVMLFLARHSLPSQTRTAISFGTVVACSALATLGLFEMAMGRAGSGIVSAVGVEALLALSFLWIERKGPHRPGVRAEDITSVAQPPHRA